MGQEVGPIDVDKSAPHQLSHCEISGHRQRKSQVGYEPTTGCLLEHDRVRAYSVSSPGAISGAAGARRPIIRFARATFRPARRAWRAPLRTTRRTFRTALRPARRTLRATLRPVRRDTRADRRV